MKVILRISLKSPKDLHGPYYIIWLLSIFPFLSWTHLLPYLSFSSILAFFSLYFCSSSLISTLLQIPFAWLTLAYPTLDLSQKAISPAHLLGFSLKLLLQRILCWLPQSGLDSQNFLYSQYCVLLAAFLFVY